MKTQIISIIVIFLCSTQLFAQNKTAEYEYDALNRLITINYGNGKARIYAYDKVGNRYSQEVNAANFIDELDILSDNINIYPNPAKDNLNIKFIEGEYSQAIIMIRDINGKTISTKSVIQIINGCIKTINVSSLKAGNYLISIIGGNKVLINEQISIIK